MEPEMKITDSESTVSASKEESILKALAAMEPDEPERIIVRPKIRVWAILLKKLARLAAFGGVWLLFLFLNEHLNPILNWSLFGLAEAALALLFFKYALTEWVLLYQRFAPERLRSSCRFEPSCSEYMLLAVKKYGGIKGFIKGIKRILRCRYPNGGVDYP